MWKASDEWQSSCVLLKKRKFQQTTDRKHGYKDRFPVVPPYNSRHFADQALVSPRNKQKNDHLL